jgi:hypothetical protein
MAVKHMDSVYEVPTPRSARGILDKALTSYHEFQDQSHRSPRPVLALAIAKIRRRQGLLPYDYFSAEQDNAVFTCEEVRTLDLGMIIANATRSLN